ncbi:FeoA family protein [Oscillospiraceae bacterium LCP25S3_E10]|nr:ferrous iron transport protein A [Ruminococcus sp.]MDD6447034.1 FeoA family protein [Ruminococcus sp.]MDY2856481.1 FeoA family protein [Oscillospiraceae bacterium]
MNKETSTLNQVPIGKKCVVDCLMSAGKQRRRLLDLGLTQGTVVEPVQKSPFGSLRAYEIRGGVIALRYEDAVCVRVLYSS